MGQVLLLDTHALIWWAITVEHDPLSPVAREAIENPDNAVYVSAVTAMEIATKVRLGKLEEARPLASNFVAQVEARGLSTLDLTADHGERAGSLPIPHKDPFDRLLIAQAQMSGMTLVSNEKRFDGFGVARLW